MARHTARKRFGQHFLTDASVLGAIVDEIDPQPGERLIEIGPGLGAMTRPLLARCGHLTVIELDRDLAARLRRDPRLTVIEADVLRVDFDSLARADERTDNGPAEGGAEAGTQSVGALQDVDRPRDARNLQSAAKLRVVGNLPYNISTPILFHLLPSAGAVADQHFMLQKEVVDRMVAEPCTKDYGRLSVMLQWRYAMESVLDVPPEAFDPPPRVHSAIVRMVPLKQPADVPMPLLEALVASAFSQRRKLLRHTLGQWLAQRQAEVTFDVQRRAEEVPVAEYLALARAVAAEEAARAASATDSAATTELAAG